MTIGENVAVQGNGRHARSVIGGRSPDNKRLRSQQDRNVGTLGEQVSDRPAADSRATAWMWFLGVGAAITVGYYVLPHFGVSPVVESLVFIGVSGAATVALLAGVAVNRPPGKLPWLVLAAAQGMSTIGHATFFILRSGLDRDQHPDLADLFYLAQYPLICAALVIVIRRRTPGHDAVALIDAAVLAVAGGLLSWVYVLSRLAGSADSALARSVSVGYPMMDLLLLAVALRLLLGTGTRAPAYRMLVASLSLQLVADVLSALTVHTYKNGSFVDAFRLAAYLLLGAAALHPSMRSLDRRSARTAVKPSGGRLVLLATASLLPLVVLVVQHLRGKDTHVIAVALAGGATGLLVLARMAEQVMAQRRLAIHDGLTGAFTAEFLAEALQMECDRARYARTALGVLLIDVDNLTLINEVYGNTAGDLVLRELAERLRVASRPGDLVARQTGDQFMVLLAGADSRLAAQMAERIREAVSATQIPIGDEPRVRVTVSVGLADLPHDGATPRDLQHAADQAVYAAKRAGRNRTYTRQGPIVQGALGTPILERSNWPT